MFNVLIHSNPARKKSRAIPGTVASAVLHGIVIGAAVIASSHEGVLGDTVAVEFDTALVMVPPASRNDPPEEAPAPRSVILRPLPMGFKAVPPVIDVPTEIPPIDPGRAFDPRDFRGIGVEGGVFDGLSDVDRVDDHTRTFVVSALDEAPVRVTGPAPRYPDRLRQAGLEGDVLVEFVIDTTGRVESASLRVLFSTSRVFEAPARDAITRSWFRPGRVGGVAVRVLVRQSVSFTIRR